MAHVAEIDKNNVVVRVVVVENSIENPEKWCLEFFGGGVWKQTSYNNKIRNKFAGIGDLYDPINDVFYSPITTLVLDEADQPHFFQGTL